MTPQTPDLVARLLRELVTLVRGECPALLDEDSGGDPRLSVAIDAALAAPPAAPQAGDEHAPLCDDCGQPLICPAGTAERIAGLESMFEQTLTRAEQAEAKLAAAPPADLVNALKGLKAEVNAVLGLAEQEILEAIGRTNLSVLKHWRDKATAALDSLPAAPRVPETPQGCPTCGGSWPCGRCTTRNVVDLDALKDRLENERLRAAAEIVKLIADDSWAITFQSLGQYRSALLKAWRDSAPTHPQKVRAGS